VDTGLRGPHQQKQVVTVVDLTRNGHEMAVVEPPIEHRAGIDHAPVERGAELDFTRPVFGGDAELERGRVHVRHRHQAPLGQRAAAPGRILEPQRPR
jgi:hypothetical protein